MPASGSMRRVIPDPHRQMPEGAMPPRDWMARLTAKQRRGMVAALGRWLNTRQLGEICARASGNAAERECRHAAERLGFHWLKFGVNEQEREERPLRFADHCLYSMCNPGQRPLRHRALSETTWRNFGREVGWILLPYLERTDRVLEQLKLGV
jgi:hypothetical protein